MITASLGIDRGSPQPGVIAVIRKNNRTSSTDSKGREPDEPTHISAWLSLLIGLLLLVPAAAEGTAKDAPQAEATKEEAAKEAPPAAEKPTYQLRYIFHPDETIRWRVVHQALVRTTVSGTTQTAETRSESVKLWKIKEVDEASGQATFVHSVESVDMRQSVSGRQDVHYNSEKDALIPAEFEDVAKAVDVPLSTVVLDNRGHVVKRHEERAQPNATTGEMTVPLPEKPVAVNEVWSFPHDTSVRQKDGSKQASQDAARLHAHRGR